MASAFGGFKKGTAITAAAIAANILFITSP
jgi:hypothetical protein